MLNPSIINYLSNNSTFANALQQQPSVSTPGPIKQPIPGSSFRINAKNLSITWPKSGEPDHLKLCTYLWEHLQEWQPIFIRVSTESHKDGSLHNHAAICLNQSLCTRDSRFFDYSGKHANIQSTRNINKWIEYVGKDGRFTDAGTLPKSDSQLSGRHRHGRRLEPADVHAMASNAQSRVDWLIWAGCNGIQYAKDIWTELQSPDLRTLTASTPINGKLDYRFEQLILEVAWVQDKCLVIVGESGVGKTTYAKRIIEKPCLMVSHIDDLRQFKPLWHKSILFDDVSFAHYPTQAQIHLVDHFDTRSIHIRYGTATIPAGTTKVFTCNEDPVNLSHPAISRRCQIVRCYQPDLVRFN